MEHPEDLTVIEARTAPLAAGVAVDFYARVQLEDEAATAYGLRPWVVDKQTADVIRLAPVQTGDCAPPNSTARDAACAKLQIEDIGCSGSSAGCQPAPRVAS